MCGSDFINLLALIRVCPTSYSVSYYLSIDGESAGPYELAAIEGEYRAKRLDKSTLCWTDRWPSWKTIEEAFPEWSQPVCQPLAAPTLPAGKIKSPYGVVEWVKLLVVLIGGLLTSCALGALMAVGEILTGYSIYGWTLWLVIPFGAILAGMGGAAGCFYTARLVHYHPRFLFFFGVVVLAVFTLLITHYMIFTNFLRDPALVENYDAFLHYLIIVSNDVTLKSVGGPRHEPIALGELSFWYYILQVVGFSLGGMLIFSFLRDHVFCRACRKYSSVEEVAELHDLSADAFNAHFDRARALLVAGHYSDAVRLHPIKWSLEKKGFTKGFRSSITTYRCPGCAVKTYRHTAFRFTNTWDELSTLKGDFTDVGSAPR